MADHKYAVTNPHNAPASDPRRGCDECGKVRAAHAPSIHMVRAAGWTWYCTNQQVQPACVSPEWIEYVPALQIPPPDDFGHCGQCGRALGNGFACGPDCD